MRHSLASMIVLSILAFASTASATVVNGVDIGSNITIYDGMSATGAWYGVQEDQEVEPTNGAAQSWDLEAFYLSGSKLTMVGGFDFKNGNSGMMSGDIFIDVNGDARYGATNVLPGTMNGNMQVQDTFGYDYVLALNFATGKYDIIDLNAVTGVPVLTTVWFDQNEQSNPWAHYSGGLNIGTGNISLDSTGTNFDGLLGDYHNLASVDLSFLGATTFIAHFTEQCGNDNLMGSGATRIPEPGTLVLVGSGLLALAGFRRITSR